MSEISGVMNAVVQYGSSGSKFDIAVNYTAAGAGLFIYAISLDVYMGSATALLLKGGMSLVDAWDDHLEKVDAKTRELLSKHDFQEALGRECTADDAKPNESWSEYIYRKETEALEEIV